MAVRYRVAGRIPDVLLPRVGDRIPVPARGRPREAVVYLFLTEPAGWAEYLCRVAEHRSEFAAWDGRIIAVTSGPGAPWRYSAPNEASPIRPVRASEIATYRAGGAATSFRRDCWWNPLPCR